VFAASYHIIKESASFSRQDRGQRSRGALKAAKAGAGSGAGGGLGGGAGGAGAGGGGETFQGRFTWRIEHFTRLKDLLKKRKITGLCIKSRRFSVGGRDCRLIVYPRGARAAAGPRRAQPCQIDMFLCADRPAHQEWAGLSLVLTQARRAGRGRACTSTSLSYDFVSGGGQAVARARQVEVRSAVRWRPLAWAPLMGHVAQRTAAQAGGERPAPRARAGQSQPPMHLSMFLEVTDPRAPSDDWSAFVSHRLAVVNQREEPRSLAKESQNRYSRAAKDWGTRRARRAPPARALMPHAPAARPGAAPGAQHPVTYARQVQAVQAGCCHCASRLQPPRALLARPHPADGGVGGVCDSALLSGRGACARRLARVCDADGAVRLRRRLPGRRRGSLLRGRARAA